MNNKEKLESLNETMKSNMINWISNKNKSNIEKNKSEDEELNKIGD
ncbi:MAG: hypothetical protein ACFFG0_17930 [Candidatus Thorarchaeota archaeon]